MSDEPSRPGTSDWPPYAFVPGGPWPHPNRARKAQELPEFGAATPLMAEDVAGSPLFRRGIELFDAGYYWEAHEAWEILWNAAGRRGAVADLLRGLIKLAAAGLKVRERREAGVKTHARRAAGCFAAACRQGGTPLLGMDLPLWMDRARELAEHPPADPGPRDARVTRVFAFRLGTGGDPGTSG